jgi:TldD protein
MSALEDVAERALDTAAALGSDYADVRVVHTRTQQVSTHNGVVSGASDEESLGFGLRVIVDGAWGFAASADLSVSEADRVAARALEIARASGLVRGRWADIGPGVATAGTYDTPVEEDAFAVSMDDKINILLAADSEMRAVKSVVSASGQIVALRQSKTFLSSEGANICQTLVESGAGIECSSAGHGDVQRRSYPNSVGRHQGAAGFEFVRAMDLPGHARRVAEEAVALLTAAPCPSGSTTVILDGSQLALQVHESCGHAIEADRALGTEAAFAGTSFLTANMLGNFRYGSPVVNLTADATIPGGLGTFGFDDEGVPAQRIEIVRDGIFVGYLTSRETARQLGLPGSNGTMRASDWSCMPLIRMTNVNLEPGTWTLQDLIADTEDGIYMQTNRSWSIDDRRLNFQFGTEMAWLIKDGRLGEMVKNATYTGMTPQFWRGCDAICGPEEWMMWGTPNCGKGQPMQVAHTGHGAAPARFRNVQVGVAGS